MAVGEAAVAYEGRDDGGEGKEVFCGGSAGLLGSPRKKAVREVLEETGWRAGPIKPLIYAEPANGITDSQPHVFRLDGATYAGLPRRRTSPTASEGLPMSRTRCGLCQWQARKSRLADVVPAKAGRGKPVGCPLQRAASCADRTGW